MLLHVGFNNMIVVDQIVGLFDYTCRAVKRVAKSITDEKPRNLVDVTRGRKARTLVILVGDRYVLSAIPLIQLSNRYLKLLNINNEESNDTGNPT